MGIYQTNLPLHTLVCCLRTLFTLSMCSHGPLTHNEALSSRTNTQCRTLRSGGGSGDKQFIPVGDVRRLGSWSKSSDTTVFQAGVRRGAALGHI